MNVLTWIMLAFSVLAGVDRIFGSKLGLGKEFEKGFQLLGDLCLTMLGLLTLAPLIAQWLSPVFEGFYNATGIDPSILTSALLANDMGAATLAVQIGKDPNIALFNGLIVSSMMGGTIAFTLPFAMTSVDPRHHDSLFFGILCGVVTIPVGCFVAGLICGISVGALLLDLLPLILFAAIVAAGLVFCRRLCVKIFRAFAVCIKALITVGLILGLVEFLTGISLIEGIAPMSESAMICFNAAAILTGAFPLLFLISRLLRPVLGWISRKMGMNEASVLGLLSSLATSITTFETIDKMDEKGVSVNGAFMVSAAFALADHLAFTLAFDASYVGAMLAGKLISGVTAIVLTFLLYRPAGSRESHT